MPRARPPLATAHRQALEKLGIGGRGGALSSLRTGHRHLFALHALKPATALTAICTMPKPPAAAAALGHYLICPNPNTNWNGRGHFLVRLSELVRAPRGLPGPGFGLPWAAGGQVGWPSRWGHFWPPPCRGAGNVRAGTGPGPRFGDRVPKSAPTGWAIPPDPQQPRGGEIPVQGGP